MSVLNNSGGKIASLYEGQRRRRGRAWAVSGMMAALVLVVFAISLNTGQSRMPPLDVLKTLLGQGTPNQALILFDFRLPRMVIAVLVGAGLAVAGCIFQAVFRNPLADPGLVGVNAGASLAVLVFVAFFSAAAAAPVFFLPFLAFAGAGGAAALIFLLSYKRGRGLSATRLILTGIAVAAGLHAAIIVLTLRIDPAKYQFAATWMAGTIWGSNWKFVGALLPWLVLLLPFVIFKAPVLNMLSLGDDTATGLGVAAGRQRVLLLSAAVGIAGACVAVSGGISFVGLICPHLARSLVGPRHQQLIPAAALAGALLLLTADTLGRVILQPAEVPAGIVVAVIGAPYFLYLLAKAKS